MTPTWREAFRDWSETEEFMGAVACAEAVIAEALRDCTKPYVSFSGGKDSTVMLHLVLQQAPEIMALHWDFGPYKMPRPVYAEIVGIARAMGVTLRIETSDEYKRYGYRARNVFERRFFSEVIPALQREGYDLSFIGLRAEESGKRRRRIAQGRSLTKTRECWPLASWTWMDVWAYIVSRGLQYVSLYDTNAELIGYERARFATMFDADLSYLGADVVDNVLHWRHRHG